MRQILFFVDALYKFSGKILYLNLLGMILISLFEGIGILLLIPLINITGFINIEIGEQGPIAWIFELLQGLPESLSLSLILSFYVFLVVGQSYFQRHQTILNAKIQQGFARHLREVTYKQLMQANWSFFLKTRRSDIINIMTMELGRVIGGTSLFLQIIAALVFTLIQIAFALWLSATMTLFVLFFGGILALLSRNFISKAKVIGGESTQLSQTYIGGITDHFNGIKDIKSNNLEEYHLQWFHDLCKRMEQNMINLTRLNQASQLNYKVASTILIAVFIFFAIKIFHAQTAQLMLILIIFSRLWPRFSGLQSNVEHLSSAIPSFNTLIHLQKECKDAKEIETDGLELNKIEQELECRNVYFSYNTSNPPYALNNINLKIPAKSTTAIVGRSGAGKSTLIDIIMGLNKPESGQVYIDGIALTGQNLLSFRRSISYVPQDPFLFNSSIRENLLIIEPTASEEEIWEALEFSSAAEFVKALPQGLDSMIGDRGIRLSGGERQRIVLARAILRKPSILVLDEATSALDSENEEKIQEAINRIKGTMTIIVIAHRLSTIRNADQVIVLEKGRIIQQGGYNQLAKEKKGMFSSLLRKQAEFKL